MTAPTMAPRSNAWFRRVSFRSRLSLLAAAAVGLALALAAFSAYFAVRHLLYDQTDTTLTNEGQEVWSALQGSPEGLASRGVSQAIGHIQASNDQAELVATDGTRFPYEQGNRPLATPNLPFNVVLPASSTAKALAQPSAAGDDSIGTVSAAGQRFRVYTIGLGPQMVTTVDGQTSFASVALVVYSPLALLDHTLSDLRLILLLVGIGGVAVALLLGYLAARAMIRPVERLTGAAEHVAVTQDLDARIEEDGKDELARLAHSFNAMLGALQASRLQQSQLVADAGHELRTPLTSLRTNIEVLMRMRDLPEDDRAALLEDVGGQLEELTTLVGDVVELAREDEQETEPEELRFDGVVQRAVDRAKRRAPSLTFRVTTEPGLVRAQPALLERAVLNVLDNAAKWSPPSGIVEVTLRRREGAMTPPFVSTPAPPFSSAPPPPDVPAPAGARSPVDQPQPRPAGGSNGANGVPASSGAPSAAFPATGAPLPPPPPPPATANRWELVVRDQGPGIAPEDIPKVFDRFYRASSARAMPGSGLGLAIVRQVFRGLGGEAWVTSPADGGTLVHLEAPVVSEDPTSAPPAPPNGPGSPATLPASPAG